MGKSTRKIIETLCVFGQPKRYIVTNTNRVVLVTYDYRVATRIAQALSCQDEIKNFYMKVS